MLCLKSCSCLYHVIKTWFLTKVNHACFESSHRHCKWLVLRLTTGPNKHFQILSYFGIKCVLPWNLIYKYQNKTKSEQINFLFLKKLITLMPTWLGPETGSLITNEPLAKITHSTYSYLYLGEKLILSWQSLKGNGCLPLRASLNALSSPLCILTENEHLSRFKLYVIYATWIKGQQYQGATPIIGSKVKCLYCLDNTLSMQSIYQCSTTADNSTACRPNQRLLSHFGPGGLWLQQGTTLGYRKG